MASRPTTAGQVLTLQVAVVGLAFTWLIAPGVSREWWRLPPTAATTPTNAPRQSDATSSSSAVQTRPTSEPPTPDPEEWLPLREPAGCSWNRVGGGPPPGPATRRAPEDPFFRTVWRPPPPPPPRLAVRTWFGSRVSLWDRRTNQRVSSAEGKSLLQEGDTFPFLGRTLRVVEIDVHEREVTLEDVENGSRIVLRRD